MAKKLYRERREFIHWLATPDNDRAINTQKAFGEKYGVSEQALSEWRHDPEIVKEVNALVDEHFADEFPEIANSLKRAAARGSYNHQKLYFEMLGKFVPKQQVELSGGVTLIEVIREKSGSSNK